MDNSRTVGVDIRLRAVMEEFRLASNPELAELCGSEASAVSNWLAVGGIHKSNPPVARMTTLCEKTGLTLDWIYRGVVGSMDPRLALRLDKRIANGDIKEMVVRRPRAAIQKKERPDIVAKKKGKRGT